jgi:hypothetical protein
MNDDEQTAKNHLKRMFKNVRYEPRGVSIAPDFVCDEVVAVEVRRIAPMSRANGRDTEMHTPHNRIMRITRDILQRLSTEIEVPTGLRYYVVVQSEGDIRIDKQAWLRCLREQVSVNVSTPVPPEHFEVSPMDGVVFRFRTASYGDQTFFGMMLNDSNVNGSVAGAYVKSISHAVDTKTQRLSSYRDLYPEHWLLLVDRLGSLHIDVHADSSDLDIVRAELVRPPVWNKILVVNPKDLSTLLSY